MIENRSVPSDTVVPHVTYQDLPAAIAWLRKTFGFSEHFRYGDPAEPSGAQVLLGTACIMLSNMRTGKASPAQLGSATQSVTVFVDNIDEHFQRTKLAGAEIVEELHETVYGERQYGVKDLEGHLWIFSKHARDLSPDEWGAKVAHRASRLAMLRRPRLCYLEIPALDVRRSADFYEKVFGWNIRHRDTSRPSFDDATGNVSGAWLTGRPIAREPGLLPYIWVDNIDPTLNQISAHGGEVVEFAHSDSPGSTSNIATFRDPAGNLLGLYQEGAG